ncbi:nitroreductase family protein [Alkalibacter mobilis]|uniref:nitroreductase family protein n=1 Tax=Alkalibacter mobilis TaxID=2787712 RepID=UPI00189DF4D1|nr:nitroreductase family protein [Alkalibacter mobilis]MBF7097658.1 hypothetical protein [Alkalibacter mobilis]
MDSIERRKSVRKYRDNFIEAEKISEIIRILEEAETGPGGNYIKFEFIAENLSGEVKNVVTYGFLSGRYGAIAGWVSDEPYAIIDYGYILEKIALNLVDLDIGTCWLGGSFSKRNIIEAMEKDRSLNKSIPAILAVGYEGEGRRIRDFLISGTKRKRKDFDETFFTGNFEKIKENYKREILEGVRWAPSAMNKQPVRVIWDEHRVHFYLVDTSLKMRYLDMGIAMSHFELKAAANGIKGEWKIDEQATLTNWTYMYTYDISNIE